LSSIITLGTTLCDKICQQQVGGVLRYLRFPPPMKLIQLKYCWKWR